ncbi:MAG: MFS transporter [Defluviitaleaceae bacterium]|nr:MFS transporter [Defluviitaleaceae bacterium]MCL2240148.1 MFS transporter [Defluviitaleaceae bacterium]
MLKPIMALKKNPRLCVLTEPMWGVPHNLYIPFFPLYMHTLGLGDSDIGLIISVGFFLQMITAFLGGVATDKFGRRRTTVVADVLSWSIPTALWAMAQDFRWFLVAAIFNSIWRVSETSWGCLLVEDVEAEKIVKLYQWVYIAGLIAVFFAPISWYFIGAYSLVPVMRVLLAFACVSMTLKFIILYKYGEETGQGRVRLEETKNTSLAQLALQCKDVFLQIVKTPATVRILFLITLVNIQQIASNNFFSLYIVQDLGVPEQFLALFPILRAGIMLAFFLGIQSRLNRFPLYAVMLGGLGAYIAGHVLLLMISPIPYDYYAPTPFALVALAPLVAFTAIDACAAALFLPRRDSLLVLNVDPHERARIMALLVVIMLGISSPFGYIVGAMSEISRRIPFMMSLGLFALMGVLVAMERGGHDRTEGST